MRFATVAFLFFAAALGGRSHAEPFVEAAIAHTDTAYLAKTLAQRNPGSDSRGSRFYKTMTPEKLARLKWKPFSHPGVGAGAVAFRARVPGEMGMIELAKLDKTASVRLEDPKNTGHLSVAIPWSGALPKVSTSTLIIGKGADGHDVVFTVHPGDPVKLPSVRSTPELRGKSMTVAEALALGFRMGKAAPSANLTGTR